MMTKTNFHLSWLVLLALLGVSSCSPNRAENQLLNAPFEIKKASYEGLEFRGLTPASFPIGERNDFRYGLSDYQMREFSQREIRDQVLDWMLLGILTNIGLTDAELSATTLDFPELRYGFFSKMAPMEYGKTRSRFVGNGLVVALVPESQGLERIDHIAHIADEHRKNIGEMPDSFWVFEYALNDPVCQIEFWRSPTEFESEVFSKQFGYHQQEIASIQDLKGLMGKIDDITYGKVHQNRLAIGGRKILSKKYKGITVEEIATIWQAEQDIQHVNDTIEILDRLTVEANAIHYGITPEEFTLAYEQQAGKKDGTGFSLDPSYNFEELLQNFNDVLEGEPIPKDSSSSDRDDEFDFPLDSPGQGISTTLKELDEEESTKGIIEQVRSGLRSKEIFPFERLISVLSSSAEMLRKLQGEASSRYQQAISLVSDPTPLLRVRAAQELSEMLEKHTYQKARYDGNLQGTSVGMHYFSTDLKAKLFALDYLGAAPPISGFITGLNAVVPWHTTTEGDKFNHLRVWLGLRETSIQLSENRNEMFFGRNATQIFSASPNPLKKGEEVVGSAALESPMVWWNNHFEEVAEYDHEYELLNQLIKWSQVAAWLIADRKSAQLDALNSVDVDHSKWFWDWVKTQTDLKFDQWSQVEALPRGIYGTETEAMGRLSSDSFEGFGGIHHLSGGVSASSRTFVQQFDGVAKSFPRSIRRPRLKYSESSFSRLSFAAGNEFKFVTLNNAPAVERIWGVGKKLRNGFSEFKPQKWIRSVQSTGSGTRFRLFAENRAKLGALKVDRVGKTISATFVGNSYDESVDFASRAAMSNNPMRFLEESVLRGEIEAFTWAGRKGEYLVKFPNEEQWLLLKIEKTPEVELASDWDFRASGLTENSNVALGRFVDIDEAKTIALNGNRVLPVVNKLPVNIRDGLAEPDVLDRLKAELSVLDHKIVAGPANVFQNGLEALADGFRTTVPKIDDMPQIALRRFIAKANRFIEKNDLDLESLILKSSTPRSAQVEHCIRALKRRFVRNADKRSPKVIIAQLEDDLENLPEAVDAEEVAFDLQTGRAGLIVDDVPGLGNLDWNIPMHWQVANIMKGPRKPIFFTIAPEKLLSYRLRLTPSRKRSNFEAESFSEGGAYSLLLAGGAGTRAITQTPGGGNHGGGGHAHVGLGSFHHYYYVTYPQNLCDRK